MHIVRSLHSTCLSASAANMKRSPRRGGICHLDFLIDYTLCHLTKNVYKKSFGGLASKHHFKSGIQLFEAI